MMLTHTWVDQYIKMQPAWAERLNTLLKESVQFDCGDIDSLPKDLDSLANVGSPFPKVILQLETPNNAMVSHALIFWEERVDGVVMLTYSNRVRGDGSWKTTRTCKVTLGPDRHFYYEKEGDNSQTAQDAMTYYHKLALNVFAVLACSNVTTVDHPPEVALNKKRAKSGKAPLLSYKTLTIVVDKERTVSPYQGGTHSSPRVHLRRGHIRRLMSGRTIWIQSCVVGSKHGMVVKDYRVTTKAAQAARQGDLFNERPRDCARNTADLQGEQGDKEYC